MLIVQGVLSLGGVKQWWGGKNKLLYKLNVSISRKL